ncbi:MAG: alanine racemase [Candidatus Solibacter usitatus]|nr:alanine racemase [Candidatus Solibacter usitatus]
MEVRTFPYRCYALISRRQIAANYHSVRAALGPAATVLGVVKANAYGHGAVEVSRVLVAEGAQWLAVSTVEEGVALRRAGLTVNILVMTGFLRYEWDALIAHSLTPVVHSLEDLAALATLAHSSSKPIDYHLKIDSGMHRLGTRADVTEILAAIQSARHANLTGLMTHLASAADYSTQQTDQQAAHFARIWEQLRAAGVHPTYVHMSATNAIAYGRNAPWLTMARPGHALYGYVSPARGEAPRPILSVQPALTWKAKILAVKEIPEGALVGYGGSFRAPHAMRIAVVAAGYADGVPHRLSNRGKVIAAGKLAPILGTVSMDLTTIDVSQAPALQPGDDVTLLGREGDASQDAQQMARQAGTISYSILCGIAGRVERVYV